MNRALFLSALSLALAACSEQDQTPMTSLPTVSEEPSLEERILVCDATEDAAVSAIDRCVTSHADPSAIAGTVSRWSKAQPLWSDVLVNTASFSQRYPLREAERECLRRALCRTMPFEER